MRGGGFAHLSLLLLLVFVLGVAALAYSQLDESENSTIDDFSKETQNDSFTFTAAGDFSSEPEADAVLRGIGSSGSDFTVALGDLGYGELTEPAWCEFVTSRVGKEHPFQLIVGNHDDGSRDGDIAEYRQCLPNKIGDISGDYAIEYYFDYNSLARIILIPPDIDTYGFDYDTDVDRMAWLVDAVTDAREAGLTWVIVGTHKNCISPGQKPCEIGETLFNKIVELKVDLLLQGHEHGYFRSHQLGHSAECPAIRADSYSEACVNSNSNTFDKPGTVLVISGAGGKDLRDADPEDPEADYFAAISAKNINKSYGYSLFEVTQDSIQASFVPAIGTFTDEFTINR